ncbi:MAG: hypothetical protein ACE1Y4_18705, partial [Lysobacterales bacterium]
MIAALNNTLAQIEQLSAQNRLDRCSDREQQLVDLRQRAALELRATAPFPAPRTAAPDLFAGSRGLPEIPGSELSADTLAAGILNH